MLSVRAGRQLTIRGGLDDQRAVNHVHPARETELTGFGGVEPDCGEVMSWQRRADLEVGEHDSRGAVARLLPVEGQLDGNTLADSQDLGAVAALDRHRRALDSAA